MTSDRFAALFGGPARLPEAPLGQREMDLAASVQQVTEEIVIALARTICRETGSDDLCLAGGVALDCVANGRLLREHVVRRLWVQPAAGDAGGAVGAALSAGLRWGRRLTGSRRSTQCVADAWYPYTRDEIREALDAHGARYLSSGDRR